MQRRKAQSIGQLLRDYLRQEGLETPLNEHRLLEAWGTVMGDMVNRQTTDLSVRNGILYVSLKSPILRQELMLNRDMLAQKLNRHVGAQVITDIVFK